MPFFNIEIKTKQNKILLNQKNRRPHLISNQFILDNPNKNKQTFRMTKLYLFLVVLFSAVSLVAGPTEGLIAYYPFNGNAENHVKSDVIETFQSATYDNDRFNNESSSAKFANNKNFVVDIKNEAIRTTEEFSVSFWFNVQSLSSTGISNLLNIMNEGCGNFNTEIAFENKNKNKLNTATGKNCGLREHSYITNVLANEWHHYCLVMKNGKRFIYFDEELVSFDIIGSEILPDQTIKKFYFSGRHPSQYFNGLLDDIRIYNRALDESEVTEVYKLKNTPIDTFVKNSYKLRKSIPSGFSMLHIPFSYHNNTITDIFGATPDLVLYEYTNNKWIINSYDPDFEEWDYPSHFLPAGTAVWVLNNSFRAKTIEFTGDIPKDWKKVITTSNQ